MIAKRSEELEKKNCQSTRVTETEIIRELTRINQCGERELTTEYQVKEEKIKELIANANTPRDQAFYEKLLKKVITLCVPAQHDQRKLALRDHTTN